MVTPWQMLACVVKRSGIPTSWSTGKQYKGCETQDGRSSTYYQQEYQLESCLNGKAVTPYTQEAANK